MIGPALVVCTRCREPLGAALLRYAHHGHVYCLECAQVLALVDGVERDPKKYGGHQYRGPKELTR